MTKLEIHRWVRQVLAVGGPLLKQWDNEAEHAWHIDLARALAGFERVRDGFTPDVPPLPPAEEDRNAPWVCIGCSLVYPVCPDTNAHDCPACGEKVCPARLWHRAVVRCVGVAEHVCGILAAARVGNGMTCKCGIAYRLHPYCVNSQFRAELASSTRPEYFLHVVCGGRHMKL